MKTSEVFISHLLIQLVPHSREHGCPGPVIWDDCLLHVAATSKLVEILTRVDSLVKLVQQVSCCLNAALSEAEVLLTNILSGDLGFLDC